MLEKFNKGPEVDFSDVSGKNIEFTIEQRAKLNIEKKPVLNNSSENHTILALGININSDPEKIEKTNNLFKNYLTVNI